MVAQNADVSVCCYPWMLNTVANHECPTDRVPIIWTEP
jgi:hypothetical protein